MVVQQLLDVLPPSGEEVVETDHLVSEANEPVAELRSQKASAASDENPLCHVPLGSSVAASGDMPGLDGRHPRPQGPELLFTVFAT
jgi:hypothetical protein